MVGTIKLLFVWITVPVFAAEATISKFKIWCFIYFVLTTETSDLDLIFFLVLDWGYADRIVSRRLDFVIEFVSFVVFIHILRHIIPGTWN